MKQPKLVMDEFISACYLFLDQWKRDDVDAIGNTIFLENDYYLELAVHGKILLCKNGMDPKHRIRSHTYKGSSPSGIAKMLSTYLALLEKEKYWG